MNAANTQHMMKPMMSCAHSSGKPDVSPTTTSISVRFAPISPVKIAISRLTKHNHRKIMKKILYAAALAAMCGFSARADQPATLNTNASPVNYATDSYVGKFVVGIILGEPTGASAKYWLNDTIALDGAAGGSAKDDTELYLHSDVLWHDFDLIPVSRGRLPVYFGVGGLVRFRDHHHDNEAGVRLPGGLSYKFDNAPVGIFAEIAPALD